ncbi:hypothetical protein AN641_04545 [Candidatus Epulonipiscioides gigas]|nr:hypothetical protein AN641_04545 [Epulopiscium sp. SCG-C07WGA-EpuloA2]
MANKNEIKVFTYLKSVSNLFKNENDQDCILGDIELENKFFIPAYQRAYSWEKKQCEKLYNDIMKLVNDNNSLDYIFGSIIIYKSDKNIEIIDGRQRITTFILLLKAVLNKIEYDFKREDEFKLAPPSKPDSNSAKIQRRLKLQRKKIISYLYYIDLAEVDVDNDIDSDEIFLSQKYSNLTIKYISDSMYESPSVKDTLKNILQNNISNKNKSNFTKNFKFFEEQLKNSDVNKLYKFIDKLCDQCKIIVTVCNSQEVAIQLFHTLNSDGLHLTNADIIGAQLYNKCHIKTKFKKTWSHIIKELGNLQKKYNIDIDNIFEQYIYIRLVKESTQSITLPEVDVDVLKYFNKIISNFPDNSSDGPLAFAEDISNIVDNWTKKIDDIELYNLKCIMLKQYNYIKFYYATYSFFYGVENKNMQKKLVKSLIKLFTIFVLQETNTIQSTPYKDFLDKFNIDDNNHIVKEIEAYIEKNFNKETIQTKINKAAVKSGTTNKALIYLNEYLCSPEKDELLETLERVYTVIPKSEKDKELKPYIHKLGNQKLEKKKSTKKNSVETNKPEKTNNDIDINEKIERVKQNTQEIADRIVEFIFSKEEEKEDLQ